MHRLCAETSEVFKTSDVCRKGIPSLRNPTNHFCFAIILTGLKQSPLLGIMSAMRILYFCSAIGFASTLSSAIEPCGQLQGFARTGAFMWIASKDHDVASLFMIYLLYLSDFILYFKKNLKIISFLM